MIIIYFLLIALYVLSIEMEARWDAEAFKEGESNHVYKTVYLISFFLICIIFAIIGKNALWAAGVFEFVITMILLSAGYGCVRIWLFDDRLNDLRNKPNNYKTKPWYIKGICLFIAIILIPLLINYIL